MPSLLPTIVYDRSAVRSVTVMGSPFPSSTGRIVISSGAGAGSATGSDGATSEVAASPSDPGASEPLTPPPAAGSVSTPESASSSGIGAGSIPGSVVDPPPCCSFRRSMATRVVSSG